MSLKRSALLALGLLVVTGAAWAEEPLAKPEPAAVSPAAQPATERADRPSASDRAALRAELRRQIAATRSELRRERAQGSRPQVSRPERVAAADPQHRQEQKQIRRDEARRSMRELRREIRDEQREANRGLIRRTQ